MHPTKIDDIKLKQKTKLKKLQKLVIKFDELGVKPTHQTFTPKKREDWTNFKKNLDACSDMVNRFISKWEKKIKNADNQSNIRGSDEAEQLLHATEEMQQISMEYNELYNHIQEKMQAKNKQLVAVSNYMKHKLGVVRNVINEVR